MTTIKSYTDLKQSKKLAEILPIESADMCYPYNPQMPTLYYDIPSMKIGMPTCVEDFPCWSLAALLEEIPSTTANEDGDDLALYIAKEDLQYYLHYDNLTEGHCWVQTDIYDNLIDACYEMILTLHEQNLL